MRRYVSPAAWSALRREWRLGRDSIASVARRYNISRDAIVRRARKDGWGERATGHDDVLLAAEVTLDDILNELNRKLAAIRDPETLASLRTTGEDARLVFTVIRDIRRTAAEVRKIRKELGAGDAASGPTVTVLDFEAAKKEVLDRFDNLAAWIAQDRAEHPPAD